ncbi:GntR family transcriptional regulator [Microbacterium timonense]|uniref:GntR family transcriptional regulator n=1 Tax=Microbacterium timonense TaxID=2086576 RepID=UPI000D102CD2|nr:GntR family transcriptional regulator [Microbacterium timonense]
MTAPFVPLEPRGAVLGDEVYERLGEAILDGRLAPGARLRDHELAEWLGVSRTPVREALQRLERAGLVEVSPHRYTRVSLPNDKAEADTFELVAYNMGIAVRMATARCDDDTLTEALERLDEVIAASRADDCDGLAQTSHAFFRVVTKASGNVALVQFVREYAIAIRRNLSGWQPFIECPLGRTAAYEQFREAFARRDGQRAEEVLRGIHGFA